MNILVRHEKWVKIEDDKNSKCSLFKIFKKEFCVHIHTCRYMEGEEKEGEGRGKDGEGRGRERGMRRGLAERNGSKIEPQAEQVYRCTRNF